MDAAGETFVSRFCQRHAIMSSSAIARWGAVFTGALRLVSSFFDSSVFLFPVPVMEAC